jgi:hypothetical protein
MRKKNSLSWGRSVEERGERGTRWDKKKSIFFTEIDFTTARGYPCPLMCPDLIKFK